MPYNFVYDLSRLPKNLFRQLIEVAYEKHLHRLVTSHAKNLVQNFRLEEATGLNLTDAITLVGDLIEVQAANILLRALKKQGEELYCFHIASENLWTITANQNS